MVHVSETLALGKECTRSAEVERQMEAYTLEEFVDVDGRSLVYSIDFITRLQVKPQGLNSQNQGQVRDRWALVRKNGSAGAKSLSYGAEETHQRPDRFPLATSRARLLSLSLRCFCLPSASG
jgi:hypothetical protein